MVIVRSATSSGRRTAEQDGTHILSTKHSFGHLLRGIAMDKLIYFEFGVVIVMLAITLFELGRAIKWEVQDAIERFKEEINEDVE